MRTEKFDVVVLGGGNAGIAVTGPTRAAGMSVALIEDRDLGGTCPNRGCTPKKVLVAAGHALHEIDTASSHCISVQKPRLEWASLIAREKRLIKGIPERLEQTLLTRGVEVIRGRARFVTPNAVRVGDRLIETEHVVIATGSRPRLLDLPGADLLKTSDDLLNETELPDSVIFIGGGVISLEFGHVYARAGVKVTVLEGLPRLLPSLDSDAVALLQQESKRIGIEIETGVRIERIEAVNGQVRVIFTNGEGENSVDAAWAVNGAGRVANIDQLDLEAAHVEHTGARIEIDPFLRSASNAYVHVCGDAVPNSPQLSPIATYEGNIVGRNLVEGPRYRPDYLSVPNAVYAVPALASVGLTESAARQTGLRIRVSATDMSDWLSARTYAETAAWAKIIVEESSDRILGAHFLGHSGEELINVFALAMAHGITAGKIKDQIYAYPTFTSDIKNLL